MKFLRLQLSLLGCILCLGGSLFAQRDTTSSRWMAGVELSTALTRITDPQADQAELFTHQVVAAKVSYRPRRWLEAWVRYRYHAVAAQLSTVSAFPTVSILDGSSIPGGMATRNYDLNIHAVLVGAELLLRIGQGDLGASFGLGPSHRTGQLIATNLEGVRFSASVLPIREWRQFAQLAYTYWPTTDFGVRLALSYSQLMTNYRFNEAVRLTNRTNVDVGSYRNLNLTEPIAPGITDFTATWQLGLGVDYRF